MATQEQDNQKLQNTANQRSQELKPEGRNRTGAGETSSAAESARFTNIESADDTDNRDVETFNAPDRRDDVIGGSSAGGVAGTGGVSTNEVGYGHTSKNPLLER